MLGNEEGQGLDFISWVLKFEVRNGEVEERGESDPRERRGPCGLWYTLIIYINN